MHLLSATVRHYRIHRETQVTFDRARTVIGGPNEVGKSTLAEAIHRGLFLKSRITGEAQHEMVSDRYEGHPEVELEISVNGRTYRVFKRFSGASGITRLTDEGGSNLTGEEAEARLGELLGSRAQADTRGAGKALLQWSHLWVWQRSSGEDPTKHVTPHQQALVQRLQTLGGAAAMLSVRDSEVARKFSEECNALYTQSGSPRTGSALERARTDLQTAEQREAAAADRVNRLDAATVSYEGAIADLARLDRDSPVLQQQQQRAKEGLEAVKQLRDQESQQAGILGTLSKGLEVFEQSCSTIRTLETSQLELQGAIEPMRAALTTALERRTTLARERELAEQSMGTVDRRAAEEQVRLDLATAGLRLLECQQADAAVSETLGQVEEKKAQKGKLELQLASIQKVTPADRDKLLKLEGERQKVTAQLQGMAATVGIVAAPSPVRVGDRDLKAGESVTLTEEALLQTPDGTEIRIQPGGGNALAEAREQAEATTDQLTKALERFGVASIEAALQACERREALAQQIQLLLGELKGMGADTLAQRREESRIRLQEARSAVEQIAARVPGTPVPAERAAAQAWATDCRGRLDIAQKQQQQARVQFNVAKESASAADAAWSTLQVTVQTRERELEGVRAKLQAQVELHGDASARSARLLQLHKEKEQADVRLASTRQQIDALQPDLLKQQHEAAERGLHQAQKDREQFLQQRARAESAIQSDGAEDPSTALEVARARAVQARRTLEGVDRKARAIARLVQLFKQEQQLLSDRFTQPLADRVAGYLQCVFGHATQLRLTWDQAKGFAGLELHRPGVDAASLPFDKLSGGAAEQTGVAVRLATAEILAGDHGGALPIVLDDAFAYSDPDRVQRLQAMLDLAARRGLQVIVLTCNPSDYITLGAATVTLRPAPPAAASPLGTRSPAGPATTTPPTPAAPVTSAPAWGPTPAVGASPAGEASKNASPEESARVAPGSTANSVGMVKLNTDSTQPNPPEPSSVPPGAEALFLSTLKARGGSSGNTSLLNELGWEEAEYKQVKANLLRQGLISLRQ